MSLFEKILQWLLDKSGPLAKDALAELAAYLNANRADIVAGAAGDATNLVTYLQGVILAAAAKSPVLMLAAQLFVPELIAFLTAEEAKGGMSLDRLITETVNWLIAEEANV